MRYAGSFVASLRSSEGKGTLGCLVSLLFLGALIVFCQRVGPPYFSYRSLEGDVATEISKAGAHYFTDEVLIQNVLDVARKNEVRLKSEDIKIERLAGQVLVTFRYSVPVDLIFFEHTFEFKVKASSFVGTL